MDPQDQNSLREKPSFFANSTNLLLLAIIFIILVLIGGISYLIFGANKTTKNGPQSTSQSTITISKNWNTFTNALGVTIDYPENLRPVEDTTKQTVKFLIPENGAPFMTVSIIAVPFANSPKGDRIIEGIKYISEWKQLRVNGQTGHSYNKNPCPTDCTSYVVDLPFNKGTQILSVESITDDRALFDEMVKRIKYTP